MMRLASHVDGRLARAVLGAVLAAGLCPPPHAPAATPKPKPVKVPATCMPAEQAEQIEKDLDAFFAEADEEKRKVIYAQRLADGRSGLTLFGLETIAAAVEPSGTSRRGVWKITSPWLADNPRGWFNFSMPAGYTPKKAWPLVVAMHGSSSDGDNVVSWYSPQLNRGGYFVVYPTTTSKGSFWSQEKELTNVYRIIDWVARRYRVDFRRLVATGGSMGGVGTWAYLMNQPEVWSVGASVAGYPAATKGDALENIRGIPFYFIHGDKDHIPVSGPRAASAELTRRGIEHTYVEVPGSGHTPPMKYWTDMNVWITRQPAKPWSPRPLFLPVPPGRPIWEAAEDPLRLIGDPIVKLIADGKAPAARVEIGRLMRTRRGDARLHVLRGLSYLPVLLEPFPFDMDPKSFPAKKGWHRPNENSAMSAFSMALASRVGKGLASKEFDVEVRVLRAKIYAKRIAIAVPYGGSAWVRYYNDFAHESNTLQRAVRGHPEGVLLLRAVFRVLPRRPKPGAKGQHWGAVQPARSWEPVACSR